jgi:hypothetical protein
MKTTEITTRAKSQVGEKRPGILMIHTDELSKINNARTILIAGQIAGQIEDLIVDDSGIVDDTANAQNTNTTNPATVKAVNAIAVTAAAHSSTFEETWAAEHEPMHPSDRVCVVATS